MVLVLPVPGIGLLFAGFRTGNVRDLTPNSGFGP